jgi:hypothetical protein
LQRCKPFLFSRDEDWCPLGARIAEGYRC